MRFLVDECTGPAVARWLRSQSHDVFSVYDQSRGITDDEILARAHAEQRIILTNDKDFGEKIYRDHRPHHGIVLLRLQDERSAIKIAAIERVLKSYSSCMAGSFIVVSESYVRFASR